MIAVADLFEAEGRLLRHFTVRTAWALVFIVLSAIGVIVGLALCFWAGYQYLQLWIGDIGAALLTGISALIAAGVLAWLAQRYTR